MSDGGCCGQPQGALAGGAVMGAVRDRRLPSAASTGRRRRLLLLLLLQVCQVLQVLLALGGLAARGDARGCCDATEEGLDNSIHVRSAMVSVRRNRPLSRCCFCPKLLNELSRATTAETGRRGA